MSWRLAGYFAAVLSVTTASGVTAQDRGSFKKQAKSAAVAMRERLAPRDRCSLQIHLSDGPLVIRAPVETGLRPGDKLLSVNGTETRGATSQRATEVLGALEPDASVDLIVERPASPEPGTPVNLMPDGSGPPIAVAAKCGSARAAFQPFLTAYDFASAGKFAECVQAFARTKNMSANDQWYKFQCTAYKKGVTSAELGQAGYDLAKAQIEEFTLAPTSKRNAYLINLRRMEQLISNGIGRTKFQELVDAIAAWPGGAEAYAATAPNWTNFRRSAEQAVSARLIDPSSAQFEWPYGFSYATWKPFLGSSIEGYVTCGIVNARNRMGGYTGRTFFVAVLDVDAAVKYVEIGNGKEFDILSAQCANSAANFPPPQFDAPAPEAPPRPEASQPTSIVDQLKQLTDLRNSGSLTEAEFQAAKAKLLATSPRN